MKAIYFLVVLVAIFLVSGCIGDGEITGGSAIDKDLIASDDNSEPITWFIAEPDSEKQDSGLESIT